MSNNTNNEVSENRINGSSRRNFLVGAAAVTLIGGAGLAYGQEEETEIRLEGNASGWVGVAPSSIEGETNPTLEFEAGTTYTVTWENGDGAPHNFVVETDADEHPVATEIMGEAGETQTVEFEVTEEMAEYYCEVHPESMRGDVQVGEGDGGDEGDEEDGEGERSADVTFEDQSTDGSSVEVASVTMSEGGFVAIHDSRLFDGDALGSVIGVSEYLEAGTHEGVTVALDEAPDDGETLVAMPHLDTNDNQTYDFVTSEGEEDGPYTDEDGAVVDDATVTLEEDDADSEPEDDFPREYEATLSGEPHGVETEASGHATFEVEAHEDGMDAHYELMVENICNVTQAHIHLGAEGEDGPIVVWLYPEEGMEPELREGLFSGTLAEGTITEDDLVGEWEGADFEDAGAAFEEQGAYVNVHTEEHPGGEIRGQIEPTDGAE